jgi:hypothetical protein
MDWSLEARANDGTFKATHFKRFTIRINEYFFCHFIPLSQILTGRNQRLPSAGKLIKNKTPYPNLETCERGSYYNLLFIS